MNDTVHFEKTLSSETLFEGRVITLTKDTALLENGKTATREVVHHHGGACILPYFADGTICMVRQFRYAMQQQLWELPAGKLEKGEDPFAAAKRELEEECGLTADNYISLGEFYPTVGYDTEVIYTWVATGLHETKMHLDADEFLTPDRVPLEKAYQMVMSGEIKDGKTIAGILKLKALLAEEFGGKPVAVCANLPYYITSPILMRLLEEKLPIRNITVMVQKEAAQRLCAAPGTRDAGAISYAVAYYAEPKLLFSVQPGSFYPAPKVTSAVIRLDVREKPAVTVPNGDEAAFFALIRAAFSQRRKTAANAIASGLGLPKDKVIAAIEAAGFDARIRPEALTLEDFAAVQRELK